MQIDLFTILHQYPWKQVIYSFLSHCRPKPGSAVCAVQSDWHTHTHTKAGRHRCESALSSMQNLISRCGETWTIYQLARVQLVSRVQYKASHQRWCLFTDNSQNPLHSLLFQREHLALCIFQSLEGGGYACYNCETGEFNCLKAFQIRMQCINKSCLSWSQFQKKTLEWHHW